MTRPGAKESTMKITLPQLAWHGPADRDFPLPDGWQVELHPMAGHDRPRLSEAGMAKAVREPIGMAPLREHARGKKQAVILFDDMARVTRAYEIVPHVLAELAAAGLRDGQIRFICANGCHGAMNRLDFEKKLGKDVMARFPVYNHSPFDNCVPVGTTSSGTPLVMNAEVMACDLKIGIGSIVPHIMAGFGGGNKIVLPGVAAYETVVALHTPREKGTSTVSGMGALADNPRRRDIDEAAAIVGLDMKLDAVVNGHGETVRLFAGAPGPAYAAALAEARAHYLTPAARGMDVVIANAFAKANEAVSGLMVAFPSVKASGGDVVLIANAPDGQMTHYLMGPFGNGIGGRLQLKMTAPPQVERLIVFSEYPELASRYYLADTGNVSLVNRWEDVLAMLAERRGPGTRAAVYPSADIQYLGQGEG
jgi:nickel-dependent lactate racemase